MNEGINPGPNNIETGSVQKPEIWIIDDDENITMAQSRVFKFAVPDYEAKFFQRGEDAISALSAQLDKVLPVMILVDGNLDKDEGEYRSGANVVRKIIEILGQDRQRVIIAGISNDNEINRQMKSAGADAYFSKLNWRDALNLLKTED